MLRYAGALADVYGPLLPLVPWTLPSWFPWQGDQPALPGPGFGLCYDDGLGPKIMARWDNDGLCGLGGTPLQVPSGSVDDLAEANLGPFIQRIARFGIYPGWQITGSGYQIGRSQVGGARMIFDECHYFNVKDSTLGNGEYYEFYGEAPPAPDHPEWYDGQKHAGSEVTAFAQANFLPEEGEWWSPGKAGLAMPALDLGALPMAEPMVIPLNQPMVHPLPLPLNFSAGGMSGVPRDPLESSGGSQPSVQPDPPPDVDAPPYTPPWQVPVFEWSTNGGPVTAGAGNGNWVPPRGREKERKAKYGLPLRALLDAGTELGDIADAFYKSLPAKDRRWKGRDGKCRDTAITPQGKLWEFYKHAGDADVDKAIQNLIQNELEDRAIGALSNALKSTYGKLPGGGPHGRLPIGFQAGPLM